MNFFNSLGKLTKTPWIIFIAIVVLVIVISLLIIYEEASVPELSFDPLTGAVVIDTLGNRDRQINPGEQVQVFLRLTNIGEKSISAFDLVLSTQDRGVEMIKNRISFSSIDTGQTRISNKPFEFKLDTSFVSECVVFKGKIENVVQAGLIAKSFAETTSDAEDDEILISLSVITNYRACLVNSILQEEPVVNSGDPNRDYILEIELMLCNASAQINKPSLKIDSSSIKICDLPDTTFNVMYENDIFGNKVRMDSIYYSNNLQEKQCKKPNDPRGIDTIGKFKFKTSMPHLAQTETKKCVYFTVEIYEEKTTLDTTTGESVVISTLLAKAYLGSQALVIHNDTEPIASIDSRILRK
ncbi:MAG: hypothetical protein ACE5JB_06840 [bacterium]